MMAFGEIRDEELVRRYRAGEAPVLDYLMEKYKGLVRQRARALYLIGADTDDLIQEGMIGLFKAVRDYQEGHEASFLTFAQLCIDRQMYHAIQTSNRQKNMPLNTYVSLNQYEPQEVASFILHEQDPEAIVIGQENEDALQAFLERELSKLEREVLKRYLQGENYSEIGRELGKGPTAIDNALQRIRRKISVLYTREP